MDFKNPPEPAAIKENQAMVKDVKDDLEENLEKTPEPAATKEGQPNDPDPSSGSSSESSSRTQKVEKKHLCFFPGIVIYKHCNIREAHTCTQTNP